MKNKKNIEIKYDDIAVAVKYNFGAEGEVPTVVASGRGRMAHRVVEVAKESGVPIREDKNLANSLAKVPVGVEIPPELWNAMAEILAQIYYLDKNVGNN